MNEHSFIRAVNRHVTCNHHWKINADFAPGVPDSFYEGEKRDLWVEYKFIGKLPAKDSTLINPEKLLTPKQLLWLQRRGEVRGDCWVIIGSPGNRGCLLYTPMEWITPITKETFIRKSLSTREIGLQISITLNS